MKNRIPQLSASIVLLCLAGIAAAQSSEEKNQALVEIFACSYNENMDETNLDAVIAKWNEWADSQGLDDYTAWTLRPFYFGPAQDFDILWMGVAPSGRSMGIAQDQWLETGGPIGAEFEKVLRCNVHSLSAATQFKEPSPRDDLSSVVLAFKGCNVKSGKNSDDVAKALATWASVRESEGSAAGHWALFPAYSGGGEEFRFHFVSSHGSLEEQGIDNDNHNDGKSVEILDEVLSCELTSRVYVAANRRLGRTYSNKFPQ